MFEHIVYARLNRVIMVCHSSRCLLHEFTSFPNHLSRVVHNGVLEHRGRQRPEGWRCDGRTVIGFVGRLTRQKGLPHLLRAMATLVGAKSNVRLVIVGDGPDRAELETQVASLRIQDSVSFEGFRPDARDWIAGFDIFVLPSIYESFPISILQAMSAGVPVVASTVDGIPEAVEGGVTGLLIPPADHGALARGLLSLVDSPDTRARLGSAGKQRYEEHFTAAGMIAQTQDLYSEMVANHVS